MMKTSHIHILLGVALILGLLSCVKEREIESSESSSEEYYAEMSFKAGIVDSSTKTTRSESGSVIWSQGEEINVFKGSSISGRFISQNEEPAKTVTFTGALSGTIAEGMDSYWAVYPYSSGNRCDGKGVTLSVPSVQTSDEGTFKDGIFPSIAHSSDNNLFFYNICGGFKISLSRGDIKEITLEGNNNESLAGKVYLSGAVGERPTLSVKEGISKISLTPSSGKYFKEGVYYYFTVLPAELSNGFTMSFKTEDRIGVLKTGNPLTISHSVFCSKDNIDSYVTEWAEYSQKNVYGSSGVYLGILGFNQTITSCPISLLTTENRDSFTSFINNLSTANGTLLYYGVDNSITALQGEEYPEDIDNIAIVTFTDGLDQGSLMMGTDYMSDEEYLDALKSKLSSARVSGLPISAYSVGVMGTDVSDQQKFRNNLNALASAPENVYELSNISELQDKFEEIANSFSVSLDYSYNIALSIPGLSDGARIRFTFDGAADASDSQKYIEGIFNLRYHSLDQVEYVGLTSANGETVVGSVEDEIFVRFTFSSLRNSEGGELNTAAIAEWYWSSGAWQNNTEFDRDTNSEIGVDVRTKSAAIYLVLDCSSSLKNDFKTMKEAANQFVGKLYAVEHRPQSVRLNRQKLVMAVGEDVQLLASVFPVTAEVSSESWESSNSSVVKVTSDGTVTAVSPGNATVTYSTQNNVKASCRVVVNKVFDISKEWGPLNPDFNYTGLYFGMLVYNKDSYKYKICRLDDATKDDILTFLDDIPVQNGTLMCSATEEALNVMSVPVFPADFSKVTLVSFTDGLDQGSVMKNDNFSSTEGYLDFLNDKISTQTIQNIPINAYSVGIQGGDLDSHNYSLTKLASSPSNVISLKDQSGLNAQLTGIVNSADVSVEVFPYMVYDLTITIPGLPHGSKVRFTFDSVNDADDSQIYIEGTFNLKERTLNDISFFGLESSMPPSITGVVDGIFVSFSFTDVARSDKHSISLSNIKEWTSSSGSAWQINSEFSTSNVVATGKEKKLVTQNSALVYLVLDYSSSVSGDLDGVKKAIKDFVLSLSSKFVGSINFYTEELKLYEKGGGKISPYISPSSAVIKDLWWTSSDESIATVDKSGYVYAQRPGQCVITATANNGVSASYRVTVCPAIVDLGITMTREDGSTYNLYWATSNLCEDGFVSSSEKYGDYYAWGEINTKSNYTWETYKLCKGSMYKLKRYCTSNHYAEYSYNVDNKTEFKDYNYADDAARQILGGTWRIPTKEELVQLLDKCTAEYIDNYNGTSVRGCLMTAPNGNKIFFPAAGGREDNTFFNKGYRGLYWSSSLWEDPYCAWALDFTKDYYAEEANSIEIYITSGFRQKGLTIRPVCE